MNTVQIAEAIAHALSLDKQLQAIANSYGRPWHVALGCDPARMPGEDAAPFILIDAEGSKTPTAHNVTAHSITISAAIIETARIKRGGVTVLKGLDVLAHAILPRLLAVVSMALPNITLGATIVEYDVGFFPLLFIDVTITINVPHPIGTRL